MNDDIMAGSGTAYVLADEWNAESLRLLARHVGSILANRAMEDEIYLPVVLPILQADEPTDDAVDALRVAFGLAPVNSFRTRGAVGTVEARLCKPAFEGRFGETGAFLSYSASLIVEIGAKPSRHTRQLVGQGA